VPKLLTKSKYMNGLQCSRLLWLVFNDPQKVPAPDASTQFVFDQGHLVGGLAKKLYPGGIDIPTTDFRGNLKSTQQLLAARRPLFEAGFMANSLYSRVDILNPYGADQWDIVEVKSSTAVKDENIQDVAFQKYCLSQAGIKVNRCWLMCINNGYVRKGEIDPLQLFKVKDISAEVEVEIEGLAGRLESMFKTIALPDCPDIPVGVFCSIPYACSVEYCWQQVRECNIFNLYRGGKKCFDMYYDGILNLRDIPDDFKLNRAQDIQKQCDRSGRVHIEPENIRQTLAAWKPPFYFLDFETINPAVPLFDGTRPYQRVPFQFSLHIQAADGHLQHVGYLAEGQSDPRPQFLSRLKEYLGDQGSIVTYNQSFEEGVLKELAEDFPDYAEWVASVQARLVDLLKPFQSFAYYNPEQHGSASIKNVLPALTGHSYQGMGIHNGDEASTAFMRVTYTEVEEAERRRVLKDLEKYCGLDTEGMLWIVEKLKEISG
jgi:hypothetical protein